MIFTKWPKEHPEDTSTLYLNYTEGDTLFGIAMRPQGNHFYFIDHSVLADNTQVITARRLDDLITALKNLKVNLQHIHDD